MKDTTIAVDVAKSVFEVAVSKRPGRVAERQRLARDRILRFFANRPPATVLLPPHIVHRYVLGNKTHRPDANGLLETFRNRDIHPVPIKSVAQQSLMALHRLRTTWLATRTARLNTIRAVLAGARPHRPDRLRARALQLQTLRGLNKATVALANKLARIVWAVWKNGAVFRMAPAA